MAAVRAALMRSERALSSGEKVHSSSSLAVWAARLRWSPSSRPVDHRLERLAKSSPGDPFPLGTLCARADGIAEHATALLTDLW